VEWATFQRPLAIIPTDIIPFTTRYNRWLARFVLNKFDLIALRDNESYNYCLQLGLSKPKICLTADVAFLLEPVSPQRMRQIFMEPRANRDDKPLIGFSPKWPDRKIPGLFTASGLKKRKREYVILAAAMLDYLIENLNATISIIPALTYADRDMILKIYEETTNKESISFLKGEYFPDELKAFIGNCDMFVGCRLHSCIAASSMGVPTLAIADTGKFIRTFGGTMQQEQYVVDIRNWKPDEHLVDLKSKLISLWENREKVREVLKGRTQVAQSQALLYGQLIEQLVKSSKASVS
jgi:polysaccharide pyruvyl transferase WcaK-like protein